MIDASNIGAFIEVVKPKAKWEADFDKDNLLIIYDMFCIYYMICLENGWQYRLNQDEWRSAGKGQLELCQLFDNFALLNPYLSKNLILQ